MAAKVKVVPSANSVLEVLNLYNYEDWSIQVKTYLIAKGLWDVIDATTQTPDPMKNAKALHTIQSSCGTDVFGFIRDIEMARDAWQTLTKRLKPKNTKVARYIGRDCVTSTLFPSVMLDLQAPNKDNYKQWSFWVRKYLVAENLWDVVKDTNEPPEPEDEEGEAEVMAWNKINARALHVITIFCREDPESSVSDIERARDAWNELAKKFQPTLVKPDDTAEAISKKNDDTTEVVQQAREDYKSFFMSVKHGKWEDVKEFIGKNPPAVRAKERHLDTEKTKEKSKEKSKEKEAKEKETDYRCMTAFQRAVYYHKDLDGVKKLLSVMQKDDLDIPDDAGHTALYLAIRNPDEDDAIVKCIVEKKNELLYRVVDASANAIPLVHALSLDRPNMVCYLYRVTRVEDLKLRDRAELVSTSLRFKHLDIALDLLRRFPELVITQDNSGGCPLNELANTRAGLFMDPTELGILKRWVWKCISIPSSSPTTEDNSRIDVQNEEKGISTLSSSPTTEGNILKDVQNEEKDQGNRSSPTTEGNILIDVQNEEKDQGNRKHLIRRVSRLGRLVAYIRHFFGIENIYQMKLLYVRTMEILHCMCDGLEKGNYIRHKFVEKALFQAVERGHAPFIRTLAFEFFFLDQSSRFLAITNEHDKTIFQFAAEHRQNKIFDLLDSWCFDEQEIKDTIARKDKCGKNMLHLVANLSPLTHISHIRVAALQMQNELQWFKKVERMASPRDLNCLNSDGLTPHEVFTMSHRELVKEGQSAMKETANSSSFVGALIITIMFTAAVTVPGGIKGDTGIPIYSDTKAFQIFIIAVIVSLCCSTTSVLASLGILTSRFAEEDFLISLPKKMIYGLLTLFVSIAGMMVAFSTAIFIMIPEKQSIVIPSIVLACVPVASFLWMEGKLLIEVINSTYNFEFLKILGIIFLIIFFGPIALAFHYVKSFSRKFCDAVRRCLRNLQ